MGPGAMYARPCVLLQRATSDNRLASKAVAPDAQEGLGCPSPRIGVPRSCQPQRRTLRRRKEGYVPLLHRPKPLLNLAHSKLRRPRLHLRPSWCALELCTAASAQTISVCVQWQNLLTTRVVNQGDEQWRFFAFESVEVTDTQDSKLKKRTMRVPHPASPAEILANLFNRLRGHSSTTSTCKCDVGWVMQDGQLVLQKPKRDTTRGRKRQREDDSPAHLVCLHTLYEGSRAA
jgi:hypothetical protein